MKWKLITAALLASLSLVACQAEQEAGDNNNANYDGVENTRFERTSEQDNREAPQNNQYDNDRGMQHNTNYNVEEELANKIAENVKGVDKAYVLKTRDNAYVAAVLDNQNGGSEELPDDVEKQITDLVKKSDQDINNVYISTNPDFVDLTKNYASDVENGEPVQGFFREFGTMVDRIFPDRE
ncbi:YhcN/YlaJ family sporulation lipoprotein [Halobacillus sp. Marseille-Q1614]|uniref:YhcN/YlaJ family sporulation lipoprotein n=1 Tax=Halobacillus sp. Marseille-Q1614 TaxID=2709134 RepID=UPI0015706FB5|nr:YhcN/YlaJ family sporulation lipoprotein [Halobacillus sp. Marseille-Q1614]